MDNASKALIIAGAVLIAVMLVSLGVLIYNQAKGVVDETSTTMTGLSVSGFNGLFSQYYGNNKTSATLKSLVEQVNSTNRTSEDRQVTLTAPSDVISGNPDGSYKVTAVKNTNFDITDTSWDTNGYVQGITITKHGATTGGGNGT